MFHLKRKYYALFSSPVHCRFHTWNDDLWLIICEPVEMNLSRKNTLAQILLRDKRRKMKTRTMHWSAVALWLFNPFPLLCHELLLNVFQYNFRVRPFPVMFAKWTTRAQKKSGEHIESKPSTKVSERHSKVVAHKISPDLCILKDFFSFRSTLSPRRNRPRTWIYFY